MLSRLSTLPPEPAGRSRAGRATIRSVGYLVVLWIISAIGASAFAGQKGRANQGLILGLLFGPLGLLIAVLLPASAAAQAKHEADVAAARADSATRACPWCAEPIQPAAIVCKHCGRDVQPA